MSPRKKKSEPEKCEHGVLLEHSCADCNRMANEDAAADEQATELALEDSKACGKHWQGDEADHIGYLCTEPRGHEGPHIARNLMDEQVATWTDPIEIPRGLGLPNVEKIAIVEEDWSRLMALLATVEETESELNDAKEAASAAKKAHDTAQAALQRALGRMRDGLRASQEPELPFDRHDDKQDAALFNRDPDLPFDGIHQSDIVQAAHDDPAIVLLTQRLRQMGQDWQDLDLLTVAGWTEQERQQLTSWCDGLAPYAPAHLGPDGALGRPDTVLDGEPGRNEAATTENPVE